MEIMLKHLYLFEGLDESYVAKIEEIAELRAYSPGELIFSQGDIADAIFMIQHGAVSINHREDDGEVVEIAKLGTGSHFGEMSMLDSESRSASASSDAYSDIVRISYEAMINLLESDSHIAIHVYREISRFLCSRLRLTSLDLIHLRTQHPGFF